MYLIYDDVSLIPSGNVCLSSFSLVRLPQSGEKIGVPVPRLVWPDSHSWNMSHLMTSQFGAGKERKYEDQN